jgi:hypothetical protein
MKPLTFRLKIALLSAGISGLVLLAFGVAAWVLVNRQKLESVDTEIRSLGARHPGWIASRGNFQRLDDALAFIFGEAHQDQIILLVKDADGSVLHTSSGWPTDLDPAGLDCTLADDPKAIVVGASGRNGSAGGLDAAAAAWAGGSVRAAAVRRWRLPRFPSF